MTSGRLITASLVVAFAVAAVSAVNPGDELNGYVFHHKLSEVDHINDALEQFGEDSLEHHLARGRYNYAMRLLQMSSKLSGDGAYSPSPNLRRGSYIFQKHLGRGTFGDVWLATSQLGGMFAIKSYSTAYYGTSKAKRAEEYMGEQEKSNLVHNGSGTLSGAKVYITKCVSAFQFTNSAGVEEFYTVWPLYDGTFDTFPVSTLDDTSLNKGLATACYAMAFLQELGLQHLDLKPENLFYKLDKSKKLDQLIIGDLGLVDPATSSNSCGVCGTHPYMPPEAITRTLYGGRSSTNYAACQSLVRSAGSDARYKFDAWELGVSVLEPIAISRWRPWAGSLCKSGSGGLFYDASDFATTSDLDLQRAYLTSSTADWWRMVTGMMKCSIKERMSAATCHSHMEKYLPGRGTPSPDYAGAIAKLPYAAEHTKAWVFPKFFVWQSASFQKLHADLNKLDGLAQYVRSLNNKIHQLGGKAVSNEDPISTLATDMHDAMAQALKDTSAFAKGGIPRQHIATARAALTQLKAVADRTTETAVKAALESWCSSHPVVEARADCSHAGQSAIIAEYHKLSKANMNDYEATGINDIAGLADHLYRAAKSEVGYGQDTIDRASGDSQCSVCAAAVALWTHYGFKEMPCTEAHPGDELPSQGFSPVPRSLQGYIDSADDFHFSYAYSRIQDYLPVANALSGKDTDEMCGKVRDSIYAQGAEAWKGMVDQIKLLEMRGPRFVCNNLTIDESRKACPKYYAEGEDAAWGV